MRWSISAWVCSQPCCEEVVDLNGVSGSNLKLLIGVVVGFATRTKTAFQMAKSGASSMTWVRSGIVDWKSTICEQSWWKNRARSPDKVPLRRRDWRIWAAGRDRRVVSRPKMSLWVSKNVSWKESLRCPRAYSIPEAPSTIQRSTWVAASRCSEMPNLLHCNLNRREKLFSSCLIGLLEIQSASERSAMVVGKTEREDASWQE